MKIKPDIYKYSIQGEDKDSAKIEQLKNQINSHSSFINDIYKNPTNNILITNLNNKKDIKNIVENHNDQLNYITFKTKNEITDFHINELNILKNNQYIDLVKLVWGTQEKELLKIFKNFNITAALSENCYISQLFATNNNIIQNIFNLKRNNENRNALNNARCETLDHSLSNKNYYQGEKHLFLSEIIIKKYVFFFYNHDTKEIENISDIFLYEYFLKCLSNYDYRNLKEIAQDAERKYQELSENDEQYKKLSKLRELLEKMFNNEKFRYKNVIDEIKNYFNDNNNIKTYDIPQYLFINDLINIGLNFDFNVMVHQYNNLTDEIKIKYEIKHLKNNMILSYKKHILDKLITKKKEIFRKKTIHKKTSPFFDPLLFRSMFNKQSKEDKNKDDDNEELINQIDNIDLNDNENGSSDNSKNKNKSKDKEKKKTKKDKKKLKERSKSRKNETEDEVINMSENEEQEHKEKSKKINNKKKHKKKNENDEPEIIDKPESKKKNKSKKKKSKSKNKDN